MAQRHIINQQTLHQAGQLLRQERVPLGPDAKGQLIRDCAYFLGEPPRPCAPGGLSRVTDPHEKALARKSTKDGDITQGSFLLRLVVDEEFCIVNRLGKWPMLVPELR